MIKILVFLTSPDNNKYKLLLVRKGLGQISYVHPNNNKLNYYHPFTNKADEKKKIEKW